MRYRANRDFVLKGKLIAFGDGLFLQQASSDQYEVYSLFTRELIGLMKTEDVKVYLDEDKNPHKDKFRKKSEGKSLKDISMALLMFILPLWGISQGIEELDKPGNHWRTGVVQTGEDTYELHIFARIDSNYFMYLINDRKNCDHSPTIKLEPSNNWELLDGPALYSYGRKLNKESSTRYCPTERYTDSILYIYTFKILPTGETPKVRGIIEYYNTQLGPYPAGREPVETYRFTRTLLYKEKRKS